MPKTKKINKKKASNVIPIKQDVIENEDPLLSIEEQERERTNKFARKLCDEIDEFVKENKYKCEIICENRFAKIELS